MNNMAYSGKIFRRF